MNTIWLFGATKFQGNPKFLFLYINHERSDINAFWVADTQEQVDYIIGLGYRAVLMGSQAADELFSVADVYVVENFRESLPETINPDIKIANLWHGVGLKHIEFGLDPSSPLTDSIVRKNVRNFKFFRDNLLFLAPSLFMEEHFIEEMKLEKRQIIRGSYPRNIVGSQNKYATFNHTLIDGVLLDQFDEVILFAPTYRDSHESMSLFTLFSDIDLLKEALQQRNALLIFKMHHFEEKQADYIEFKRQNDSFDRFLFWDVNKDIYEIFDQITTAIVDYSSIYYDLLQAGVSRFIRYVPDFDVYSETRGLKYDYLTYTDGAIAYTFNELITALKNGEGRLSNRKFIEDCFFGYSNRDIPAFEQMEKLITDIEGFKIQKKEWKKLYSFDVFDTLIQRNTIEPTSIFYAVQSKMKNSALKFPEYLVTHYPQIRREMESDLRDVYRKTTFERDSESLEITFDAMFDRFGDVFSLNDEQLQFLKDAEIESELLSVRPIQERINFLLEKESEGHDVILISDMYLPVSVVKDLLYKADKRLTKFDLYLSSEIGDQKSSGKLFKYIFFKLDYCYSEWIHFGDNHHADGDVPKKLGITVINHGRKPFTPYERYIVNSINSYNSFLIASLIYQKRMSSVDLKNMTFDYRSYYSYSYISAFFVPYVFWFIKDALNRGYETLYFISRDGYYLKDIADLIIRRRGYDLKTKYIYGSRKAWRLPAQINKIDDEFYLPFGLLSSANSFDEIVEASLLDKSELLSLVPQLSNFQNLKKFPPSSIAEIRQLLKNSTSYNEALLVKASKERENVLLYLSENIDFTEKFAFIEFWGRGYTQDLLTRLLKEASKKDINNPFYYMRSYNSSYGDSVRHRYTQAPLNFTFVEPIFASTPYESISGYEKNEKGEIAPIIRPTSDKLALIIKESLLEFTNDYLNYDLDLKDDDIGREFAHVVFDYHIKNPHDQYINTVYSEFEYSASSYKADRKVAIELTKEILNKLPVRELGTLTSNLAMSLSKSDESVRELYEKKCILERVRPIKVLPKQKIFPYNDLSNYIKFSDKSMSVMLLKPQPVYSSTEFIDRFKTGKIIQKGTVIKIDDILLSKTGVPRVLTEYGYISAHKSLLKVVNSTVTPKISVINELKSKYITKVDKDEYLIALTDLVVYKSPSFLKINSSLLKVNMTSKIIPKGHLFLPKNMVWGDQEMPVIQIHDGYVSANRNSVAIYSEALEIVREYKDLDIILLSDQPFFGDELLKKSKGILSRGTIFRKLNPVVKGNKAILAVKNGYIELNKNNIQRVRKDIENYHCFVEKGMVVKTLAAVKVYEDINFTRQSKSKPRLKKGQVLKDPIIVWTEKGTPRFKIEGGYITAGKKSISFIQSTYMTRILKLFRYN